jgi:hypothetical protein
MTDRYRSANQLSHDLDVAITQFIQFLTTEDLTVTITNADGNPVTTSSLSQAASVIGAQAIQVQQSATAAAASALQAAASVNNLPKVVYQTTAEGLAVAPVNTYFGVANTTTNETDYYLNNGGTAVYSYSDATAQQVNNVLAATTAAVEFPNLFPASAVNHTLLAPIFSTAGSVVFSSSINNAAPCWKMTSASSTDAIILLGSFPLAKFKNGVVSASLTALAVTASGANGTAKAELLQFDATGAEITASRQSILITNALALTAPTPVSFTNIPLAPTCVNVRLYLSVNAGTQTPTPISRDMYFTNLLICGDASATYRPPYAMTAADLAAAEQAQIQFPNLFHITTPAFTSLSPVLSYNPLSGGPATLGSVNGVSCWNLTDATGDSAEQGIYFGPFPASAFTNGVISASALILAKGLATNGSARALLTQYDATGAEITASRQTFTIGASSAITAPLTARFDSIALAGNAATVRLYLAVNAGTAAPCTISFRDLFISGNAAADWYAPLDTNVTPTTQTVIYDDDPLGVTLMVADLNHLWTHGQSLSLGINAGSTVSGAGPANTFMPDYGVLDCAIWDGSGGLEGTTSASSGFATLNGGTNTHSIEPPDVSMALQFAALAPTYGILVSNSGHGSYAVDQLNKAGTPGNSPTQPYQLAVNQMTSYKEFATAAGLSIITQVMVWLQGENDISNGTDPSVWKAAVVQMLLDFATDTTQALPLAVMYQTNSHTKRTPDSSPDIGIAQWEMITDQINFFMASPTYFMPFTDGVHLTANGYRRLGCYIGRALYRILVLGRHWRPVTPTLVWRQGVIVTVQFRVPVAPLVIDTTLVTDPGDYGFEVWLGSTQLTIASVVLGGPARVVIKLTVDPGAPVTVKYAVGTGLTGNSAGPTTGARGCLRDSDPTLGYTGGTDTAGAPYVLQNWCPMFSMAEGSNAG